MAKAKSQTIKTTNTTTKTKDSQISPKERFGKFKQMPCLWKVYEKGVRVFDRTYKNKKKVG